MTGPGRESIPAGVGAEATAAKAPRARTPAVATALDELAGVGERPLVEHPDAFGRVHASLQQALSEIDDA